MYKNPTFILLSGLQENGNELVELTPTSTLHSSKVEGIALYHEDMVYVTIVCANELNFRGSCQSLPIRILALPPSSNEALVEVIPRQFTYDVPRDDSQIGGSEIEFRHIAFKDMNNVNHFQYMLHSGDAHTDWISVGKLVSFNGL